MSDQEPRAGGPRGEETEPQGGDAARSPEDPATDSTSSGQPPIRQEHLVFAAAGILLGAIGGYTLAFQVHSPRRPGFEPPARPNVAAMEPGTGVQARSPNQAGAARPPFLNEDGSIDMTKVPEEIRDQMEQAKAALEQHRQMLEEDPENTDLMLSIGRFYLNLGMVDKALGYYDRAVETEPGNTELQVERGLALYDAGRFPDAVAQLESALEQAGEDPDLLTQLSLAYLRLDRVEDSLEILDRAAEADQAHAMSRFNRAVILLFARRDPDAAEQALEDAARLLPEDDARMQMLRGAIREYRETGQLPQVPTS